ncbi:hypothetical protein [Leptotrichia sp. oral taxon 212]|uniref:hypothetical protein n=1 Tax=Leptotrichia sp. oral taxon 212 TaxID=712357 RepID=UPI0006A9735A|nr:hypothetical protein [Leptotrichia sp. oral taxon 212]ALA95782.1 hypothetical protein AMK43_06855 [Leptotrichia sp. oral taxon 212]
MKWRNEELSKNGKIRLVFISVSVAILIAVSVFVSVIYLAPLYKKYKIEKARKEKILAEKEKDEWIKQQVKDLDEKFKNLKVTVEKNDNPENPVEIKAEKYYIINSKKFTFATNVIYSDKFIYLKAYEMVKYKISQNEWLYFFRGFEIRSKNGLYSTKDYNPYGIHLINGRLFSNHSSHYNKILLYNEKKSEYEEYRNFITTDYTDLASSKEMTLEEITAAEKVMENLQKSEANTYDNLRSQMKKEEEKKKESGKKDDSDATNIYYYQKNNYRSVFSKEELEKLGEIKEYEYRRRNSGNSYGSSYSNGKSESYSKEEYNEMLRNEGEITDDWEWESGEDNGEISKWED